MNVRRFLEMLLLRKTPIVHHTVHPRSTFIDSAKTHFQFLEGEFHFRLTTVTDDAVTYESSAVQLTVFYRRRGGEIGVEFGLLSDLARMKPVKPPSVAGPYIGHVDHRPVYEIKI